MRLTVYFPEDSPTTHDFVGSKLTVGRLSDNDVQLDEGSVSSRHAEIELRDGHSVLRDLGSTNGTFYNGLRLKGEVPIAEGDEMYFGNVRAVYAEPIAAAPTIPAVPESSPEELVGDRGRPDNFHYMSPLAKREAPRDMFAIAGWGCAGLGLLAGAYALYVLLGA